MIVLPRKENYLSIRRGIVNNLSKKNMSKKDLQKLSDSDGCAYACGACDCKNVDQNKKNILKVR